MSTVGCRVKPVKLQGFKRRKSHDVREQIPNHADPNRLHLNEVIIPAPSAKKAHEMIVKIKSEAKARQKFNSARNTLVFDGLLFFDYEAQAIVKALDTAEFIRRVKEAVYAVCQYHRGILIGLAIHMDESAPHAHFQLLGVGPDGRILRIGPKECKARQDVVARPWADLGIKRGKPKKQRIADGDSWSKIINMSVKELHKTLPEQLARLRAKKVMLEDDYAERNAHYRTEIQKQGELLVQRWQEYREILERLGVANEVLGAEKGRFLTGNAQTPEKGQHYRPSL